MALHLSKEINNLKKLILQQSTLVEQAVKQSIVALQHKDAKAGKDVISGDVTIDRKEVDLEEECLKILALHQPVAFDLRYVITCLKINNDLERIGDLAVRIATRAVTICDYPKESLPNQIFQLASQAQELLRRCINSLMEMDIKISRDIILKEEEIDAFAEDIKAILVDRLKAKPELAECYMAMISAARNIQRLADYAANIAEDIIYMITGEIVRHQKID